MLGMGFFKSLVKHHGKTYFEPIGKALAAAGIKQPNPLNPAHVWALKDVALPYVKWMIGPSPDAACRAAIARRCPRRFANTPNSPAIGCSGWRWKFRAR